MITPVTTVWLLSSLGLENFKYTSNTVQKGCRGKVNTKSYCEVQIHKGFAPRWVTVSPDLTGDGVRFPTKRSVTGFGNDGDFCIRPIKVSPGFHWLVSYVEERLTKQIVLHKVLLLFILYNRAARDYTNSVNVLNPY